MDTWFFAARLSYYDTFDGIRHPARRVATHAPNKIGREKGSALAERDRANVSIRGSADADGRSARGWLRTAVDGCGPCGPWPRPQQCSGSPEGGQTGRPTRPSPTWRRPMGPEVRPAMPLSAPTVGPAADERDHERRFDRTPAAAGVRRLRPRPHGRILCIVLGRGRLQLSTLVQRGAHMLAVVFVHPITSTLAVRLARLVEVRAECD